MTHIEPPQAPHGEPLWFDYMAEWTPTLGHFIEESAMVYLRTSVDGTRWLIDGSTVDGNSLDSDDGPVNDNCTCGDAQTCETARQSAENLALPNAEELLHMLAESLGYTLTKKPEDPQ